MFMNVSVYAYMLHECVCVCMCAYVCVHVYVCDIYLHTYVLHKSYVYDIKREAQGHIAPRGQVLYVYVPY